MAYSLIRVYATLNLTNLFMNENNRLTYQTIRYCENNKGDNKINEVRILSLRKYGNTDTNVGHKTHHPVCNDSKVGSPAFEGGGAEYIT